jgi:tetratricopeptide (TPR) repeat protein
MTSIRAAKIIVALLVSAIMFAAAASLAKEKPFTEVRSPNFRVLTDGSDNDGRRIAKEFEQMHQVFAIGFPSMRLSTGAPLIIFAVQNENDMRALAPEMWKNKKGAQPAGFFRPGWDKQFALVRLDQDIPGAYQVVYHEYVHSLLHMNMRWLPTWLDEGLAEYYGNTRFDGKKYYVGAPSPRVEALWGNRSMIPLDTLLKIEPYRYFHGDEFKIDEFYAESWALVHFMMFGPNMERGKKRDHFLLLLQKGEPQLTAFQEVFGPLKDVQAQLEKYVRAYTFNSWISDDPHTIQEKDFAVRKLSNAESDAELAGFRLSMHEQGKDLIERALQEDSGLGLAHEEKGFIDFGEGKNEEAQQEFLKAYDLDRTLYLTQYFTTMMSAKWETPQQRHEIHLGLLQTVQINPQFAPAYVELAMLELADGHADRALAMSRKAEQLEPSRAGYHLLSGGILLRLGRAKEAAESARYVAERWHGPDHNEAVALWNRIPEADRPADAIVGEEVEEQSQAVEGKIVAVACGEKKKKEITLQRGDQRMVFESKGRQLIGFSDTLWYGSDHFNFCHHVEGMRAVIRYRPAVGNEYAGDWLSVELRDDLPLAHQQDPPAAKDSAGSNH